MQTSYGTNGRIFTALNLVRYENLDIFEEYLETLSNSILFKILIFFK